jgi:hypothetical protein
MSAEEHTPMRAGIGLIGLLVSVGLVVWLFSMFSIPTAREGKKAQERPSRSPASATTGARRWRA